MTLSRGKLPFGIQKYTNWKRFLQRTNQLFAVGIKLNHGSCSPAEQFELLESAIPRREHPPVDNQSDPKVSKLEQLNQTCCQLRTRTTKNSIRIDFPLHLSGKSTGTTSDKTSPVTKPMSELHSRRASIQHQASAKESACPMIAGFCCRNCAKADLKAAGL